VTFVAIISCQALTLYNYNWKLRTESFSMCCNMLLYRYRTNGWQQ
jgi:hypothetical protein